jgi:C_GCAxxG_C_C family probable redox protein
MLKKKMITKQDKDELLGDLETGAAKYLGQSQNCAQSTFAALKAQFELDDNDDAIFHALTAFPGIAGRAETCGACSGSMMALGLVFGPHGFEQARLFCQRFEQENGSTQCGKILESKLGRIYKFPEDMAAYLEDGGGIVCLGVVQKAVRIAGEIILDHQSEG